MFPAVEKNESFADRELAIGAFWKEQGIYEKTLAARTGAEDFVFYEGPPTANGMPHPGHCLTRAIKDLFPRYKTMRGYRCERKAGWDTHGLPVEVEVCKELGIHSKEEIEAYGIEPFIQKCQASVWRYMQEWERLTERLGFWVDLDKAYVTYHQTYVESVWWSLKTLFDRGQLYQGHKILWWWAQGGTALSAGEVGQGYREVADPSVFVKFSLLDDDGKVSDTSLLVWTTTPWTLPSNQFAAVHPEIEYATVVIPQTSSEAQTSSETNEKLVLAKDLVEVIAGKVKHELKIISTCKGSEIVGKRYQPPFDCYYATQDHNTAWHVVSADFVTTDSGSGAVHQAPAFGEVDYEVLVAEQARFGEGEGPKLLNCVAPDGKFTDEAPEFVRGRWVKDCDKDINRNLKERGLLFHQEQYRHDYPFCWRAEEDPLIQYPRESWFIRTTDVKDQMLANNAAINWMPGHIQDGRFGKFLESNVDWALSRERYWGTPLPIWVCEVCSRKSAVGSYDELLAQPGMTGTEVWEAAKAENPDLPDDLRVHKPYIDAVTYDCACGKGRMRRVTEVIDCWYDSGAMPFAQWGYRGQESGPEKEHFESQFPADFISEAIDQTRGWFYSQLAISTMLFGKEALGARREALESETGPQRLAPSDYPHPFRNCIVLGLMLGEDGQKMSKSKRNYRDPSEIFDLYGADALRWYFFANQPPWTSIRYSEQAIKDSIPEFLLRLWNVYSFFTIYANIDEFDPNAEGATGACGLADAATYRPIKERGELDRWILSELNLTCATVVRRMDEYDNYTACQSIIAFVDALSNWYVRRSRDRFWSSDKKSPAKLDAYWTLYECLLTTTKLIAPFVPFLAESLWQKLAVAVFDEGRGTKSEEQEQADTDSHLAPRSSHLQVPGSVHLCDYPTGNAERVDGVLSDRMTLVRHISSLGRNARNDAQLKVRQPLAEVIVILADPTHQAWIEKHAAVIADELNVKQLVFSDEPEKYVEHEVLPNFKLLGPRLGRLMNQVKPTLAKQSGSELLANIRDNGRINITIDGQDVELTAEEIEIRLHAKEGWAAANAQGVVVILATELSDDLIAEGLARDLVRSIQDVRKGKDCAFTDRIEIGVATESAELHKAIEQFREFVRKETLAVNLVCEKLAGVEPVSAKIGVADAQIYVKVAS